MPRPTVAAPRAALLVLFSLLAACNGDGLLGAPCDSPRDCSADNLVCDTAARECVECLANTDCFGEDEVCLGRSCRVAMTCESSRQCPGQVCDSARGFCVDCVSDVDCGDDQTCQDSVCVDPPTGCQSDRQCSELGQVCDTAREICVDCVRPEDCTDGDTCSADNRCVPRTTECDAGQRECVGDGFRRCQSDGSWGDAESCLEGQSCDRGMCLDPSCTPACGAGELCVQGTCVTLTCTPDCTADEVCDEGVCRCGEGPRCEAGTACRAGSCVATTCDPACAVGETCTDGECRCGAGPSCTGGDQCEGGACVPPACTPACDAGEACVAGACRCGSGPACGADEVCDAGSCRPIACTPSCDTGETCVAGACRCGSGPPCGASQACVSGTCRPTTCTPACAAGETCDFGTCRCGTGAACAAGQTCVAGTCTTPMMCSESPCRLVSPQCGCAGGQACDLSGGSRGCFAAGSRMEGQACDSTNRCAAGLTCNGPSSNPYCMRFCSSDAQCTAGGGSICELVINDSGGAPLANVCGIDCDPMSSAGCRTGTACEIVGSRMGSRAAVTACRAITVFPFPICTGNDMCPSGQVCGGTSCTNYCRMGSPGDCPSPQVCTAFTDRPLLRGVEYGFCQ